MPLEPRHSSHAAPFLIVHGELDAHVPVSQGLELHAALRALSVPATLHLIPDGDHFINESHRIVIQTCLLEFFTALEQEYASLEKKPPKPAPKPRPQARSNGRFYC